MGNKKNQCICWVSESSEETSDTGDLVFRERRKVLAIVHDNHRTTNFEGQLSGESKDLLEEPQVDDDCWVEWENAFASVEADRQRRTLADGQHEEEIDMAVRVVQKAPLACDGEASTHKQSAVTTGAALCLDTGCRQSTHVVEGAGDRHIGGASSKAIVLQGGLRGASPWAVLALEECCETPGMSQCWQGTRSN